MKTEPILKVYFFQTDSKKEPVREWLKDLPREDCKTIGADIKLVQFRWPLGLPLVRKMETDLWEIRCKLQHGNIARIFFSIYQKQMILLHGFIKKSQKTPKIALELARTRKNQWLKEAKINE